MRCQTFNAPLGAKPVMTLLGSEQATTLVVVMTVRFSQYFQVSQAFKVKDPSTPLRSAQDDIPLGWWKSLHVKQ